MNKFLISFFALSLAFFLIGALRFFYPEWFPDNFFHFGQNTEENTNSDKSEENAPSDEAAQKVAERILEETPKGDTELFQRAQQFFSHGALSFAEKDLALLVERNPQHKQGFLLLIKLHIRTRDFTAAEAVSTTALGQFPDDPEVLLLLGDLLVQQGKFSEAKDAFAKLPTTSPERDYFLGVIAIAEKDYELAQTLLKKAQSSDSLQKRAEILLAAFKEFSLFPDGSPLHLDTLLAKALNDVGLYELALSLSRDVLLEDNGYRDAWLINGYAYLALERYEFAQNSFQKAFDIDPSNPVTSYYLGLTLKRLRDLDGALNFFERADKNGFKPKTELLKEIADTHYLKENYDLAFQTLEKMLQLDSGDVVEFIRPMHIALNLLKRPELGVTLGTRAVEEHPNNAMAWNLLGWAHIEAGELGKAEEDLQKALSFNQSIPAVYLNFGILREKQGRNEEALDLYEKVYEMDPLSEIGAQAVERYNRLVE